MNIKKMLFSTLAALILLTSCSASTNRNPTGKSGEADAGNLADDYIILTMENQDALYLGKVNIHTGSLTPLCTDPVCNHFDMSCPMYGINPAFTYIVTIKKRYKNFLHGRSLLARIYAAKLQQKHVKSVPNIVLANAIHILDLSPGI